MPQPPSVSKRAQWRQIWYQRGRRGTYTWVHRLDGPAVVTAVDQEWFFQGDRTVRVTNWSPTWRPTLTYSTRTDTPHAPAA